ncbi:hypothetical protein Tco_0062280 [Tanacetum coccineum]
MRLCHRLIAFSISRRGQAPKKVTTTNLFYPRSMDEETAERLRGLTVVVRDLTVIDMDELARLHIWERLRDTWAWVARGPERHQVAMDRGAQADQEIPKEGIQANPAPVQAPQVPPAAPAPRTMPQRMMRLEEEVYGLSEILGEQRIVLDGMS